ncbi:hypothetical protein AB0945_21400 [Streptomyces sp. NPDC005474]|uniref:hypothetical protein n=1 Tax=Streptomyces sp. NPDC005474 TaxID=3154878 RepID=UPI00345217BC
MPGFTTIFSGGNGTIYEISKSGLLSSYRDMTATGGSLLTPEYTFPSTGQKWNSYPRIWADVSGAILAIDDAGNLNRYEGRVPFGGGTQGNMALQAQLGASASAVKELRKSSQIWSAGDKIYGLSNGEIRAWDYSSTVGSGGKISLGPTASGTVMATGLADVKSVWSPGPNTFYTYSGAADGSGIVKGYTGSPLTEVNDDVASGLYGSIFADTAACLAPMKDGKPYFGAAPPVDADVPPIDPEQSPDPVPAKPSTVTGKFTLGNGKPAAGLPVIVEPIGLLPEDDSNAVELPVLGATTTAADGTWTLKLPDPLPAAVQAAADANGGALDLQATATGKTTSGVVESATDHFTATSPETPRSQVSAATVMASEGGETRTAALLPLSQEDITEPTASRMAQSWSSQIDKYSADTIGDGPLPLWQTDTGAPAADYNPYLVNGADIRSQSVTPMGFRCGTSYRTLSKKISYTTVGEGHALWDAKASVDYDEKLSVTIEIAESTGGNWKISGSTTLGGQMAIATGYSNKGPYFAKEWRVPIEYKKVRETKQCGSIVYFKTKIIADKYKIPPGGSTGKYGKDVSNKDTGGNFSRSPLRNRAYVPPGSYFQLSKGKSIKYSASASVYGVSLGATSAYDRNHSQRITAGNASSYRHNIWGKNGPLSDNPGVFYSY